MKDEKRTILRGDIYYAIGVIRELKDIGVTVYFEKENLDTATLM